MGFLDRVGQDPSHDVVWVSRELHGRAVDRWLRPFADQGFSLADAVGFEVMRERGALTAFTFDQHFATARFDVAPGGVNSPPVVHIIAP